MAAYTGGLLEADTFPAVCPAGRTRHYISFAQAMKKWDSVRRNQPWDPAEPNPMVSRFAADLHTMVAIALGLEDFSRLKLFTAVGSAIDWHGYDAWFEMDGIKVTLDVTLNPQKEDGYKADVLIGPEAVENDTERFNLAAEIAQVIISALASRPSPACSRRLRRWQPRQ